MYAAVIVETREFAGFGNIVRSHLKYLPTDWKLEVYCSQQNHQFVMHELMGLEYRIVDSNVVITNTNDYNKLLLSTTFWQPLSQYEKVLVFQSDSEILRTGIEEFLQWDYVGAPWPFDQRGGNGGLSIRNPKVMMECIEKHLNSAPSIGLLLLLTRMMVRRKVLHSKLYKALTSK
jgi:hypothetical protein